MATMNVVQWYNMAQDRAGVAPIPATGEYTAENVTIGAVSATMAAAANDRTTMVTVTVDAAAYVAFGTAPTAAAAGGVYLPANYPWTFGIPVGQSFKVAGITA